MSAKYPDKMFVVKDEDSLRGFTFFDAVSLDDLRIRNGNPFVGVYQLKKIVKRKTLLREAVHGRRGKGSINSNNVGEIHEPKESD